nr:MAG TPA: hypothetical protein [Caudoviricetes sp.]
MLPAGQQVLYFLSNCDIIRVKERVAYAKHY